MIQINSNSANDNMDEIDIIINTIDNDENITKKHPLILHTKFDSLILKTDNKKPIFVEFTKHSIYIKVILYEDTYFKEGIFEYVYNIINNRKSEYLLIILFYHIVTEYRICQIKNYNHDQVDKSVHDLLNEYLKIHTYTVASMNRFYNRAYYALRSNRNLQVHLYDMHREYKAKKEEMFELIDLIKYRLEYAKKENVLASRSIKSILGNFEETLSPNMIHKILTWLKKKNKKKYGNIKRGIKEEIIIDLKKYGIHVNADLLCKFIDENIPSKFAKEWNINLYSNGKRLKNDELRKLFKEAFYKKEKESIRFKIVCPRLNSLPQNIESLIISYL
tara:strand:- start:304 stop:1302 length:999 start_codon:yes stop_codon:yes gene_type:complete